MLGFEKAGPGSPKRGECGGNFFLNCQAARTFLKAGVAPCTFRGHQMWRWPIPTFQPPKRHITPKTPQPAALLGSYFASASPSPGLSVHKISSTNSACNLVHWHHLPYVMQQA